MVLIDAPPLRWLMVLVATASCVVAAEAQECARGPVVPEFGYRSVSCQECLADFARHEVTDPGYRAESVVHAVHPGGAAAGKLMDGDTLVLIDGLEIGSREAAIRLAINRDPTLFTFRRNGVRKEATVTPTLRCAVATNTTTATVFTWGTTPGLQGGWLGIGLRPDSTASGGAFTVAPTIERVDPDSPASRAGLAAGWVLSSVDGLSMRGQDGASRLAAIHPGDRVQLGLYGPKGWLDVALTAERRPADLQTVTSVITTMRRIFATGRGSDTMAASNRLPGRGPLAATTAMRSWQLNGTTVEAHGMGIITSMDSAMHTLTIVIGRDTVIVRGPRL